MERWTYRKCLPLFCYGDEENARIYAVHLTAANQREIRRAYLVSVYNSQNKAEKYVKER